MTRTSLSCDARGTKLIIRDDHLRHWGGSDPTGRTVGANNQHLTLDGEPWPIVAGEFHPQRYPRAEWAEAVRALRAGGCTMVSSYWFWNLVEPEPGRFDFTGPNDIAAFARICAEHGMWFTPRIGPFNNAEFLLGGLPPWLYGMPVTERSNDPAYLDLVARYYAAIGDQLRGWFWGDGGPIAIVQLENELSHAPNHWRTLFGYTATDHRGPEGDEFTRHMAELRRLAIEGGIAAPIFSMTGWGTAGEVPGDDFLPSYGGYFDLHPRLGPNSPLTTFGGGPAYPYRGRLPIAFSELGTGSPGRAAYRPMSPPEMMITTALTRLGGAESIFLGYYLAHGGTNPVRGDGFGWMTKEPAFGLRSYDFWAPVSEFGERRDSFYRANPLNLFVREFGGELARTASVPVQDPVTDPDDDRLRAVVRADDHGGFVFLSNYGNNTALSDRDEVTVRVTLAADEVVLPRQARLAVPSAGWAILPVNLELGHGVTLRSATAQPLARLGTAERPCLVSFAPTAEPVEYVLEAGGERLALTSSGGTASIPIADRTVELITLDRAAAERAQVITGRAGKRLVISEDELTETPEGLRLSRFVPLGSTDPKPATLRLLPGEELQEASLPAPRLEPDDLEIERLSESRWVLRVAAGTITEPDDLWIDLDYVGDLCRAFDTGTGRLIADNFNQGVPWRVKLGRFASALTTGVQFRVEPVVEEEAERLMPAMLLDSRDKIIGPAAIRSVRPFAKTSALLDADQGESRR
ncbi:beta-galactosidase [Microlunatus sp. GCM10028923]|uniref:beta-galactosidase n=1 Tax=Microlunatus sp. GCM10028923 TaxID=3273400 RepID=UPI003607ECE6